MSYGWDDQDPWVTGIEFTEQPFYYRTIRANPSLVSRPIGEKDRPYPAIVKTPAGTVVVCTLVISQEHHDANRAISSIKLATVESDLRSAFEGSCKIYQLHQHIENNLTSFTQGFCVQIFESLRKNREQSTQQMLVDFAIDTKLKLSLWDFDEATQSLWQVTAVDALGGPPGQEKRMVTPLSIPPCHPAFIRNDNNSVFKCLRDVWNLLQKCPTDLPGVDELKHIARTELGDWLTAVLPDVEHDACPQQPFVVIEGLDGVGKSTLVQNLAKVLHAKVMKTPPDCLMDLRPIFDTYPSLIRRIYYSIGNYIVGKHIRETCKTCPVVMDRFWSSTAAYTIASECPGGDESVLPPRGHQVYSWPADLLQPTLVLLLTVDAQERDARLRHRMQQENVKETPEEELLSRSKLYQRRITEAYKRMVNPTLVEVPADCTREQLLQRSMDCIHAGGHWNPVLTYVHL